MLSSISVITIAIALGLVIGLVVLLILQVIMGRRVQRLTQPIYEYARERSQAEADRILNQAREDARKMLADSQDAVDALVKKQREDIESRAGAYQKSLEDFAASAQHAMEESSHKASETQIDLSQRVARDIDSQRADIKTRMDRVTQELDGFLKQSQVQSADIQRAIEASGKSISEAFTHMFADVSAEGKKRIDARIDEMLAHAEEEVSGYREARKRLVDEHMADLITETSKIVLRKALTPDEHAELVDRALKEAHTAGMI